jgi:hypothetical protein
LVFETDLDVSFTACAFSALSVWRAISFMGSHYFRPDNKNRDMKVISEANAKKFENALVSGQSLSAKKREQLERYKAGRKNKGGSTSSSESSVLNLDAPLQYFSHELTNPKAATIAYLHTLADPWAESAVGVPIVPGGLTVDSTIVKLVTEGSFYANNQRYANVTIYGAQSIYGPTEESADPYAKVPGPAIVHVGHKTLASGVITSVPTFAVVPPPSEWAAIEMPSTGLDLTDSEARLVSCELRVRPVDTNYENKGMGMMATPGVWAEATSLGGQTYAQIFEQKRNPRDTRGLNGWQGKEYFSAVYVPQVQQQLFYTDCPTSLSDMAGLPIMAFSATGCSAGMAFEYEICWNYEINNNKLVTSSPKPISSGSLADLAIVAPAYVPAVRAPALDSTEFHSQPHVAPVLANAMKMRWGAKALSYAKAMASKAGGRIKAIAPSLAKLAPAVVGMIGSLLGGSKGLRLKQSLRR